jgi:outer membrane receptor protein involved in Fe transport
VLLRHQFNARWFLLNRAYYSRYNFNLFSNFTFVLNDSVNGDEIQQKEKRNLYGWQGSLNYNGFIGKKNYQSEFGYGFRYDDVKDIALSKTVNRVFLSHLKKGSLQETNVFAWWQNTIDISKQLELNAGLRYDWFNFQYRDQLVTGNPLQAQQRGVLSPKINLAFSADKNLKFFISSGVGFHSNDTRVILTAPVSKVLPKVYALDAGAILKPAKGLLLKTTVWSMYSEQEFVYVGDEGVVEPSGETRRYGIDLSARYQVNKWLFADVDINLTKARAVGEGKGHNYVPLAAGFTSIGGFTAKTEKGFSGSLRYRTIGNRPANEDMTVVANGYFLLDALVSYRWKAFELSLSVQNLLNSEWKEAQFDTN